MPTKPTLYLMFGYPGAGKTTTAAMVAELTGAVHLSSDNFRLHMFPRPLFNQAEHAAVYGAVNYMTELFLSKGISVIYDANLNRYEHRQEKYDICKRTNSQAMLLWINTPRDTARNRALHEDRLHLAPHNETLEHMFNRIADVIESPTPQEPTITLDGTNLTKTIIASKLHV